MNTDLKQLVEAVRSIPADNQRDQLRWLCQVVLSQLAPVLPQSKSLARHLVTDWTLLGFETLPEQCPAWFGVVLQTYLQAVNDNDPWTDLMTPMQAQMFDSKSKDLSQHFTPEKVAKGTVQMAMKGVRKALNEKDTANVLDMCCGAGGLTLGLLKEMEAQQLPTSRAHIHMVDLDPLCCAMAVMQLVSNIWVHGKSVGPVQVWCCDVIKELHTASPVLVIDGMDEQGRSMLQMKNEVVTQ